MMTEQEINDLIKRAYHAGFDEGMKAGIQSQKNLERLLALIDHQRENTEIPLRHRGPRSVDFDIGLEVFRAEGLKRLLGDSDN